MKILIRMCIALLALSCFIPGTQTWKWTAPLRDVAATIAAPTAGGTDVTDVGRDITTIQDQMVQDVAERCAVIIASGLDDTCEIAMTTPAKESAQFEQLLNAWND